MIEIDDRDRYGAGGIAVLDFPAEPEPEISRPNTAPAYYLGHPARLWITVMRPRHRRTTSGHSLGRPPDITVRVSRLVLVRLRWVGIASAGEVTVSDGIRLAEEPVL